jgi:hypothetical protein
MIFNVGARRSGTYWLQRITCAHPAVAEVPSETHLFSDGIAPLRARLQHDPECRDVGTVFADRDRVVSAIRRLCDAVFEGFARPGQTHVSERTPWHVEHLPLIAEIYPDARFVHIIRDGRDAVRSLVHWYWGPTTISEAAAEWRRLVEAGRAATPVVGDRLLEVRYEDLLADLPAGVERIYAHVGLKGSVERALAASESVDNLGPQDNRVGTDKWRDAWGRRERRDFDRVAGDLLRELGYDQG